MQFEADLGLEKQLKDLEGGNLLEDIVASTLSHLGYTVFPNLKISMDGENICEIDVFASLHTPLKENRILFECKGGEPNFKDIRNLHSLYSVIAPKPDRCIIVCKDGTKQNRKDLAEKLGIYILEKSDLVKWLLPLLGGGVSREEAIKQINRWIAYFQVHRFLSGKATENPDSKKQKRFLNQELWWKADPIEQAKLSFEKARNDFLNTTAKLAKRLQTNLRDYLKESGDDGLEGAMFMELYHRMMNMYAVTRCSLHFHTKLSRDQLLKAFGPNLRDSIVKIGAAPRLLFGFPAFFQYWIAHWGGVIIKNNEKNEIEQMAIESKTTTFAIQSYIDVIKATYSSDGSDGCVYDNKEKMFFKYVPGALRALGILNRKNKGLLISDSPVFSKKEDGAYIAALERALTEIGGVNALKW